MERYVPLSCFPVRSRTMQKYVLAAVIARLAGAPASVRAEGEAPVRPVQQHRADMKAQHEEFKEGQRAAHQEFREGMETLTEEELAKIREIAKDDPEKVRQMA